MIMLSSPFRRLFVCSENKYQNVDVMQRCGLDPIPEIFC